MNPSKRVQLFVLCIMAVALLGATPALSGVNRRLDFAASAELTAVVGGEPSASGRATARARIYVEPGIGAWYDGELSVTCSGLKPAATYEIEMCNVSGSVFAIANQRDVANGKGSLTIKSEIWGFDYPYSVLVYRVDPSGNVLVLSGTFTPT